MLRQNLIDQRRLQKLVVYSITKKYDKLSNSVCTKTSNYIHKLIRNTSELKHLEAENLVRSCLCYRNIHCKQFITSFKKLRSTILATLVNTVELTEEVETHEMLLGPSMHTPTTEPYFPESSYHSAALDANGKVILNKFPLLGDSKKGSSKITAWACSPVLCKLQNKAQINKAVCDIFNSIGECDPVETRYYIQHIDECNKPDIHDPC